MPARWRGRNIKESEAERRQKLWESLYKKVTMPRKKKPLLSKATTAAKRSRLARSKETEDDRQHRLEASRRSGKARRERETEEEREHRLLAKRLDIKQARSRKTPKERNSRAEANQGKSHHRKAVGRATGDFDRKKADFAYDQSQDSGRNSSVTAGRKDQICRQLQATKWPGEAKGICYTGGKLQIEDKGEGQTRRMGRPRGGGASYGLRRQSSGRRGGGQSSTIQNTGVELMMECVDDALSPSQLEATKKAKEEYRKAVKMIEAAKADAAKASAEALRLASQPPAKSSVADSPDIMIVGETPAPGSGHAQMPRHPVGSPAGVNPAAMRGMVPTTMAVPASGMMEGPGAVPQKGYHLVTKAVPASGMMSGQGAVPQQVYRFVSLNQHNNATANNAQQNQWFLRPIMPVMPQQQPHNRSPGSSSVRPGTGGSPMSGPTIVSGTSGLGIKRPIESPGFQMPPVSNKKPRGRPSTDSENGGGSWVPLDEYYYGKMEGDPTYTEEKSEFRFKCWMCTKMLYNNVKAMMHMQGHIDSEKQQNLDLSDLTQCKYCYKQFDTPFEMQTHIEKIHMNNINVLMCRICEKDHESRNALTTHMRQNHCACEMPYNCQLCNFRSSMYSDVVDHFKKKHDSSDNMLCLYCLRVFHVKFVSQGWGQTQPYYHHLLRHQTKTGNRKCTFCKLSFFNPQDMKQHRKTSHQPNQRGVMGASAKCSIPDQVMIKIPETGIIYNKKSSGPKSLNAPTISKVTEHRGLRLPQETASSYCTECHTLMNTSDHYKKYIQCSMCRFATSCSFAYATHMMGFHSGQLNALAASVPAERSMAAPLYCLCGFSSKLGNRVATHLVACSKRTCYLYKPELPPADKLGQDDQVDPRRKPDASILDALGLVKKQVVNPATEDGEENVAATTSRDISDWENQAQSEGGDTSEKSSVPQEHKPETFEAGDQEEKPETLEAGNQEDKSETLEAGDRGEPMEVSTGEEDMTLQQAAKDEADTNLSPSHQSVQDSADSSSAGIETQDGSQGGTGVPEQSKELDLSEKVLGDSSLNQDTEASETGVSEAADETGLEGEVVSKASSETCAEGEGIKQAEAEEELQPDTAAEKEDDMKECGSDAEQDTATREVEAQPELTQDNEEITDDVPPPQSPTDEAAADDAPMEFDREEGASPEEDRAAEEENDESNAQATAVTVEGGTLDEDVEQSAGDVGSATQCEGESDTLVGEIEGEYSRQSDVEESHEPMHSEEAKPAPEEDEEPAAEQEEEVGVSEQRQMLSEETPKESDWEAPSTTMPEEDTSGELPQADPEGSAAMVEGEDGESLQDADNTASADSETAADKESVDKEAEGDEGQADREAEGDADTEDKNTEGGGDSADKAAEEEMDFINKDAEEEGASTERADGGDRDSGDKVGEGDRDSVDKEIEENVVPESQQPEHIGTSKPAAAPEEQEPAPLVHQPEDSERPSDDASGITSGDGGSDPSPAVVGDSKPEGKGDPTPGSSQPEESQESSKGSQESRPADSSNSKEAEGSPAVSSHSQPYSSNSSSLSSSKDRQYSKDRSYDRQRDHSGSYSDYRDRDRDRDYRRDRDRYDRDYNDRYRHHDRYRDQRYDSHHGRYQQGGHRDRDRYYDQDRHGNRGGQNRHGYQDRSYHRGYN